MTRIAIHGAAGRMGLRLVALAREDADLQLAGAIDRPGHPQLGQDAGMLAAVGPCQVPLSDRLPDDVDVVIDFTIPQATRQIMAACRRQGVALVIGTTGLTDDDHRQIDAAAADIAVLQAPNMSLGVNLLFALAGQVARQLATTTTSRSSRRITGSRRTPRRAPPWVSPTRSARRRARAWSAT